MLPNPIHMTSAIHNLYRCTTKQQCNFSYHLWITHNTCDWSSNSIGKVNGIRPVLHNSIFWRHKYLKYRLRKCLWPLFTISRCCIVPASRRWQSRIYFALQWTEIFSGLSTSFTSFTLQKKIVIIIAGVKLRHLMSILPLRYVCSLLKFI
jgi:hypothetical protein